jgi:hypothetical protein
MQIFSRALEANIIRLILRRPCPRSEQIRSISIENMSSRSANFGAFIRVALLP